MNRIVFLSSVVCIMSWGVATQAEVLPKQRAGLWESTIARTIRPARQVIRQCIDDKTETLVEAAIMGDCERVRLVKTAQGYEAEAACQFRRMTSTAKSVITGDFISKLSTQITSAVVMSPGQQPIASNMMIDEKYVGPCAADQKPGDIDIVMPNGKVVRMPGTK